MGEFVAVEPDSGRYFLGTTATAALVAAHAAMPNNLFYLTRVGSRDRAPPSAVSPQGRVVSRWPVLECRHGIETKDGK